MQYSDPGVMEDIEGVSVETGAPHSSSEPPPKSAERGDVSPPPEDPSKAPEKEKAMSRVEKAKQKQLSNAIEPPAAGCPLDIEPQRIFTMLDHKSTERVKARDILDQYGRLEGLYERLRSSPYGIDARSVDQRREWLGENALPPIKELSFCDFVAESFDEMMILLSVLGALALIIQMSFPESGEDEVHYNTAWIDGTFILVAVTLVILITSVNNYQKEQKFRELDAISDRHAFKVFRKGNPLDKEGNVEPIKVDHTELVVGDVCVLSKGDLVPADGIFISGGSIIDESALTGETDPMEKAPAPPLAEGKIPLTVDPFIISGTNVTGGEEGKFLICAVGERSFSGHIEMGLRKETPGTPLQEKLDALANLVGKVGMGVAFWLLVILGCCNAMRRGIEEEEYDARVLLDYAIIAVSIIVVAVPEGLPLSVTIALAYSMKAMQKDNNMVRSLMACETMGAATNICSDKTGTLTQNEMMMTQVTVAGVELQERWKEDPSRTAEELGSAQSSARIMLPKTIDRTVVQAFVECALYNTEEDTDYAPATDEEILKWVNQQEIINASTDGPKGPNGKGLLLWGGNKTEVGIVRWCRRVWPEFSGKEVTEETWKLVRERAKKAAADRGVDVADLRRIFPHDSVKKSSTTVVDMREGHESASKLFQGRIIQFTKGAPERILKASGSWLAPDGSIKQMSAEDRASFEKTYERYSKAALRGIAIAYCELDGQSVTDYLEQHCEGKDPYNPDEEKLTLLGICGIQDPPRVEVPDAVRSVQEAGVLVRMCTGDNTGTGTAIAQECGLISAEDYAAWQRSQDERTRLIAAKGEDEGDLEWQSRTDLPQKFLAMTGDDFRRMFCILRAQGERGMKEFYERLRPSREGTRELGVRVLARCTPLQKQLFVGSLMMLGEVVAVTGDGCNDAPALKLADVGFAMDAGHQVAKKASRIILLDNNFVSVVKACKWGRNVNDSIRKFLQFQLTVNVVLLIVTFVGAVADVFTSKDGAGKPPMAAIHLLWANLIMDTMAAMALSTEKPHPNLVSAERGPIYRQSPLISKKMWRFILWGSIYQLVVTLVMIFGGKEIFKVEGYVDANYHKLYNNFKNTVGLYAETPQAEEERTDDYDTVGRTLTFNIFIYMQVFNWFSARKLFDEVNFFEGFERSPWFLPIVIFTAGFQAFMVEVAQTFLQTKSIGWERWLICIAIALFMWPWMVISRFIPIEEDEVEILTLEEEAAKEKEDAEEGEEEDDCCECCEKKGEEDGDDDEESEEPAAPSANTRLEQIREVFDESEKHYRDAVAAKAQKANQFKMLCQPKLPDYPEEFTLNAGPGQSAVAVWKQILLKLPQSASQRKFIFTLPDGSKTECPSLLIQQARSAKQSSAVYSCVDEYEGPRKKISLVDRTHLRSAIHMDVYEAMSSTRLVGQIRAAIGSADRSLKVYRDAGVLARSRTLRVMRGDADLLQGEGLLSEEDGLLRIVGQVQGWESNGLQPGVYIRNVDGVSVHSADELRGCVEKSTTEALEIEVAHLHDDDANRELLRRLTEKDFSTVPLEPGITDDSVSPYMQLEEGVHTYEVECDQQRYYTTNRKGEYKGWFTGGKMPSKWSKPPSKYLKKTNSLRNPFSSRRQSGGSDIKNTSANEPADV